MNNNQKSKENSLKQEQLKKIFKTEDLSQISIFKSKVKYNQLRKDIADCETIIVYMNFFWMIAIGAVSAIIAVIDEIINTIPLTVDMAFKFNKIDITSNQSQTSSEQ